MDENEMRVAALLHAEIASSLVCLMRDWLRQWAFATSHWAWRHVCIGDTLQLLYSFIPWAAQGFLS